MAIQLQLRRGTTAENDVFVGGAGELTMDTDTNGLRIHDGNTTGGFDVPVLVAVQRPTADNNYTWYRKYSDGWIEQGGISEGTGTRTITLPVFMTDGNYTAMAIAVRSGNTSLTSVSVVSPTDTGFQITVANANSDSFNNQSTASVRWQISGIAAS